MGFFAIGVLFMGVLGTLVTGCSRSLDLARIVTRNIEYEIGHPVQTATAKMEIFPRGNPGLHAGWIGHSTVLLSFDGTQVLLDPNFSNRIKIARRVTQLPLEPEEIKDLDVILVTHAHYDHLDIPSLKRLPREALLIVPEGCGALVKDLGFSRVSEMGWNQVIEVNGLRIEAFRPNHWGRRRPWDDEERGYNSYILSKNGKGVLFAGDTGYSKIFGEKGKDQRLDLAIFPISAYKPDWFRANHCTPEEALQMFLESGARFMIPVHWGTFILSHEPIEEPLERLRREAVRLGIQDRVIILKQGESFTVPD